MAIRPTPQSTIKDHSGKPIVRHGFYAADSLCYPQSRTPEERLVAESRATHRTLYHITWIGESNLEAVFLGKEEPENVSFQGEKAVEFAAHLRPVGDEVVRSIADRHYQKARAVETELYKSLKARTRRRG